MIRTRELATAVMLCAAAATRGTAQISAADSAMLKRADHARIEGSPTATVWLIEMSDFQCPFCRRWHEDTYPAIKRDYVDAGKIRIAYVNLPLSMHKNALNAARAAMCAAAQDRFWPMHDQLFQAQASWESLADPTAVFDTLAKRSGVDVTAMHACLASHVMDKLITADAERAHAAGASSTPTFMVPGQPQLIAGAEPLPLFRQALDAALAASSKP